MDIAVTNFTVDIPKTLRADVPSYKPVAEVVFSSKYVLVSRKVNTDWNSESVIHTEDAMPINSAKL